jgi:hypothetical protein
MTRLVRVDEQRALAIGVVIGWVIHATQPRIKAGLGRIGSGIKTIFGIK